MRPHTGDSVEFDKKPAAMESPYLTRDATHDDYKEASADHASDPEAAHDRQIIADRENPDAGHDPSSVRKTMRKVDRRLLPILGALYSISLIDRTNISNARVAGAGVDLNLTAGSNYSIPLLVFFVSLQVHICFRHRSLTFPSIWCTSSIAGSVHYL